MTPDLFTVENPKRLDLSDLSLRHFLNGGVFKRSLIYEGVEEDLPTCFANNLICV